MSAYMVDWLQLGPALCVLMVLILMDIAVATTLSWVKSELSSWKMKQGLLKKVGILVYVAIGMCFDLLMVNYQTQIGLGGFKPPLTIATFVSLLYCTLESLSVMEKLDQGGVPMPAYLSFFIKRFKRAIDSVSEANVLPAIHVKIESDHRSHEVELKTDAERHAKERIDTRRDRKTQTKLDDIGSSVQQINENTQPGNDNA